MNTVISLYVCVNVYTVVMSFNRVRYFTTIVIIILVGTMYYILQEPGPRTTYKIDDVVSVHAFYSHYIYMQSPMFCGQ